MILHCLKQSSWEAVKNQETWGEELISRAIKMVLPFLRNNSGEYMKNPEFSHIADK